MSDDSIEKIVIIGSGPAGLTAALYTARANLSPLVVQGMQPGGQLTITTEVENFPGFEHGIAGPELMETVQKQATRFGTRFLFESVSSVDLRERPFTIRTDEKTIRAHSVIVATGASAKWLGIESEKRLMGFGVSACATCDGFFFRGKEVVIVGGGDTAMEEASFLTKFCTKVTIVHRRKEFRASKIMLQRIHENPKIAFALGQTIEEILGEGGKGGVRGIRLRDVATGESSELRTDGVFIAIGHQPNSELFRDQLAMDGVGYLEVKHPSTMTSVEGVFAAGDIADPTYRQAISAAGEGCKAAIDAERWLAAQGIH
jgi:thioredoxin reductase (NADPH)